MEITMKSLQIMTLVIAMTRVVTAQGMNINTSHTCEQVNPRKLTCDKILVEFFSLRPIQLSNKLILPSHEQLLELKKYLLSDLANLTHEYTGELRLAKVNHVPIITRSNSNSPIPEIENTLRNKFNISPSHSIEITDKGHMDPLDFETYFANNNVTDEVPDSPICFIAREKEAHMSPASSTRSLSSNSQNSFNSF